MKILVFGLKSAGKTCLIQNVLGGKSWKELKSINPTEFIDSKEYIYRGLLRINIFDLGGQEQFIKEYYKEEWINNIFSNCFSASGVQYFSKFIEARRSAPEGNNTIGSSSYLGFASFFAHPPKEINILDKITEKITAYTMPP